MFISNTCSLSTTKIHNVTLLITDNDQLKALKTLALTSINHNYAACKIVNHNIFTLYLHRIKHMASCFIKRVAMHAVSIESTGISGGIIIALRNR
jgi:hypothetical protein